MNVSEPDPNQLLVSVALEGVFLVQENYIATPPSPTFSIRVHDHPKHTIMLPPSGNQSRFCGQLAHKEVEALFNRLHVDKYQSNIIAF